MMILEPLNLIPVWPIVGHVVAISMAGGILCGVAWFVYDVAQEWWQRKAKVEQV